MSSKHFISIETLPESADFDWDNLLARRIVDGDSHKVAFFAQHVYSVDAECYNLLLEECVGDGDITHAHRAAKSLT